jgi:hypothetical protein
MARSIFFSSVDVARAIRYVLMEGALVGLSATAAFAETVSFLDTALPVDSVAEVDATHVTISLGSERFLTLKDQAGARVATIYASKPELARKLPWTTFVALVAKAAGGAEREFAKVALHGALTSSQLSEEEVRDLLAEVTSTSPGRKALVEELASTTTPIQEQSACNALVYVGGEGAGIKQLVSSSLGWMEERCPGLLESACKKSFQDGDPESAQRYLDTLTTLFSAENPNVQAATVASERLRAAQDAFRSGSIEKFEVSMRVISMDPLLKDGFSTIAPTMTLAFAQKQLEENQAGLALRALATLDFSYRSNAHHEVLSKILSSITVQDAAVFTNSSVQKALWSYSSKDESIRGAYIALLSALIRGVASGSDAEIGIVLLSNLRELRPDPSAQNNELRVVLGEALLKQGNREAGSKLLAEAGVSTSSALTWARFVVPLLVGVFGAFVAAMIFRRRTKVAETSQPQGQEERTVNEDNSEDDSDDERPSRNFVSYTRNPASVKELSEYEELLAKFSLEVGAKSTDIKLAYRNAVKSYHPDLNPDGGQREADMFIDITKTYERLLELHQERERRGEN